MKKQGNGFSLAKFKINKWGWVGVRFYRFANGAVVSLGICEITIPMPYLPAVAHEQGWDAAFRHFHGLPPDERIDAYMVSGEFLRRARLTLRSLPFYTTPSAAWRLLDEVEAILDSRKPLKNLVAPMPKTGYMGDIAGPGADPDTR